MSNQDRITFYLKVTFFSAIFFLKIKNIFCSVYDNKKFKDDNFLGQCELPIVATLPEQKPDSSPSLGEKDCVLRLVFNGRKKNKNMK